MLVIIRDEVRAFANPGGGSRNATAIERIRTNGAKRTII